VRPRTGERFHEAVLQFLALVASVVACSASAKYQVVDAINENAPLPQSRAELCDPSYTTGMESRLVNIGPLEILLPEFAMNESVVVEDSGLTSLVVVLGPAVLTVWHGEGRLDDREPFLARILASLRPRRHERSPLVLGGMDFDAFKMFDAVNFSEFTAAAADFFGDFVCVAWGYKDVPPNKEDLDHLIDKMVEGMVVRRPLSLPPDALQAWMAQQEASRGGSDIEAPRPTRPWWKLWQ
jgi:hypothetical protein